MVTKHELEPSLSWSGADMESDWDDYSIKAHDPFDDEILDEPASTANIAGLAAWRRLEILRENQRLRSMLRDLADDEEFEYLQDMSAEEMVEYSY